MRILAPNNNRNDYARDKTANRANGHFAIERAHEKANQCKEGNKKSARHAGGAATFIIVVIIMHAKLLLLFVANHKIISLLTHHQPHILTKTPLYRCKTKFIEAIVFQHKLRNPSYRARGPL